MNTPACGSVTACANRPPRRPSWKDRFEALPGPQRARFKTEVAEAKGRFAEFQGSRHAYNHFKHTHPEALRRLDLLDDQIVTAAWEFDVERRGLDGIAPTRQRFVRRHGRRAPLPGLERGLDLGIGL